MCNSLVQLSYRSHDCWNSAGDVMCGRVGVLVNKLCSKLRHGVMESSVRSSAAIRTARVAVMNFAVDVGLVAASDHASEL